jgi:hypothetical protein
MTPIDDLYEQMRAVNATNDKNERGEFTNPLAVLRMRDLLAQARNLR